MIVICKGHNLPGGFRRWLRGIHPGARLRCATCDREWVLRWHEETEICYALWLQWDLVEPR